MSLNTDSGPTPLLFNDVYFNNWVKPLPPSPPVWAPFTRLPSELRLHIWHLALQQHRMIELDLCLKATTGKNDVPNYADDRGGARYAERNHLGRIVSSRNPSYTCSLRGRRSYAPTLSVLLRVSREARTAALSFYHIHLPLSTGQVLYLSSEYDVVYIRRPIVYDRNPLNTMLVDFLHDARAYDYKDHGIRHLALDVEFLRYLIGCWLGSAHLHPELLHPAAATSFADILRHKLRSLLCVTRFRNSSRYKGFPMIGGCARIHFAQTFPLRRRGHSTGGFHWLQADPRPGVELDLRQVLLPDDPRFLLQNWRKMEHTFGVTRNQQPTRRENDDDGGSCSFYICPTNPWSKPLPGHIVVDRAAAREAAAEADAVWSRDELAQYLEDEENTWYKVRWDWARLIPMEYRGALHQSPKYHYSSEEEAEMFKAMEKLPCTTIGMWLFPAEALPEPTQPRIHAFDLSALRPSLLLFQV
ncbi:hypothetical protein B0J18DRAFT_276327 [Chaetomium sp. MPI-SDFR-AT-0129]|nr:hypothetical protein B0J18DRAFT_276327 [Chaetomium sp. MPI-SDFR-AT-0129]